MHTEERLFEVTVKRNKKYMIIKGDYNIPSNIQLDKQIKINV